MPIYNIPFNVSLASAFANHIKKTYPNPEDIANILVITPTKNSIFALQNALLKENKGEPTLLPKFISINEIEPYDTFWNPESVNMDSSVMDEMEQNFIFAKMISKMSNYTLPQSIALAKNLSELWDELVLFNKTTNDIMNIPPNQLASHWVDVKQFLEILSIHFPKILESEGKISKSQYRYNKINELNNRWKENFPASPIYAMHITYSAKIYTDLLSMIAKQNRGGVFFHGIDLDIKETVEPSHPQYAIRKMLSSMGVKSSAEIDNITFPQTIDSELANTVFSSSINEDVEPPIVRTNHINLMIADNEQEEDEAIALAIRAVLEDSNKTVSFITTNTKQRKRVQYLLKKYNVNINSYVASTLLEMKVGVFFVEITLLLEEEFNIHRLLSLLSSPYFTMGYSKNQIDEFAKNINISLRGSTITTKGLEGIVHTLKESDKIKTSTLEFLEKFYETISKLKSLYDVKSSNFHDFLKIHSEVALELSKSNSNIPSLYENHDSYQSGNKLHSLLENLLNTSNILGEIQSFDYSNIIKFFLDNVSVNNASREFNSRAYIFGFIESRLQQTDVVIIGNLIDGNVPAEPTVSAWINENMRKELGLQSGRTQIGLIAHDFCRLITSKNPQLDDNNIEVILSFSKKSNNENNIPSRFLQYLNNLFKITKHKPDDEGFAIPRNNFVEIIRKIKNVPVEPIAEPKPNPNIQNRNTKLYVTDLDIINSDSYKIYTKNILKIKPLEDITYMPTSVNMGIAVHRILERYVNEKSNLLQIANEELSKWESIPQIKIFSIEQFKKRIPDIENFFEKYNQGKVEYKLTYFINIAGQKIELVGKSDYISELNEGYVLIDYKTGAINTNSFQLPTIGYLIKNSTDDKIDSSKEILGYIYVKVSINKKIEEKSANQEMVLEIDSKLTELLEKYLLEPFTAKDTSYDHLARNQEWEKFGVELANIKASFDSDENETEEDSTGVNE